ncbi:3'-5' exonuclease isoform X2 [Vigna angularis]|uniref:3'-5' exonuclease-like isoform X2 n=1 Tax=Phaseolus angularis TaxID=3914 RepID=UPI0022B4A3C9|nr:3'-5' exonuclease-like isoform X2 [Vigna angularis]XP_052729578.1 3'-5' exonuclease isoform X2 [Vigna angularis]
MPDMLDHNGAPISSVNATPSRVATISVVDHCLPYETHNLYDVTFHTHTIHTLLTSDPSLVHSWISTNVRSHQTGLMVGLDIEWRPNTQRNMQNPVATLQLCLGQHCLVFQILHSPSIPPSLVSFLADSNVTFFGVGIEEDAEKLLEDYNLHVVNIRDLRSFAAEKLRDRELNRAGIKSLGLRVLGLEFEKPKRISRSRWDNPWLTPQQVQYATVDAFLSYEIGRRLSVYPPT